MTETPSTPSEMPQPISLTEMLMRPEEEWGPGDDIAIVNTLTQHFLEYKKHQSSGAKGTGHAKKMGAVTNAKMNKALEGVEGEFSLT